MISDDTIAALATPPGAGAIAVIRISGSMAYPIIQKILPEKIQLQKYSGQRVLHTRIIDPFHGDLVDDVLLTLFRKPSSYTGEDVIEISCHGGQVIPYRILNLLYTLGVRAAERGEFTKRAFLNNKIDLTQAEAVADLIAAPTITGARFALSNVFKRFKNKIDEMKSILIDLLAHIEVCIDYPEEGIPEADRNEIFRLCDVLMQEINEIIVSSKKGRRLSDSLIVVLAGKTNVGKSSLLNYLAREERAIVSSIHGTTRDALEINIEIEGVSLTLVDTAGLREAGDEIERMGKEKTYRYLEEAHLVLFVADSSREWDEQDKEIFEKIRHREHIIVLNKADIALDSGIDMRGKLFNSEAKMVLVSALKKTGIEKLEETLAGWLKGYEHTMDTNAVIAGMRSVIILQEAWLELEKGKEALEQNEPPEFLALLFREALNCFGRITGEISTEDVLNRIFERFCVGK